MTDGPKYIALKNFSEESKGWGKIVIWGAAERIAKIQKYVSACSIEKLDEVGNQFQTLIVVGGGTRIDAAKQWRADQRPDTRLIAIPSIWGSGAESSPIVAQTLNDRKDIRMGPELLPDAVVVLPELLESLSMKAVESACGDSWSHALEGFLSPLADHYLREEMAACMRDMLQLPIEKNPAWFELSAMACNGQSRASVGLIHGIAHTLECRIPGYYSSEKWGHARLCTLFLYPVTRFNQSNSNRFSYLFEQYNLDSNVLLAVFESLFNKRDYNKTIPFLEAHWPEIMRDACTRTNSTLVRRSNLLYFTEAAFL